MKGIGTLRGSPIRGPQNHQFTVRNTNLQKNIFKKVHGFHPVTLENHKTIGRIGYDRMPCRLVFFPPLKKSDLWKNTSNSNQWQCCPTKPKTWTRWQNSELPTPSTPRTERLRVLMWVVPLCWEASETKHRSVKEGGKWGEACLYMLDRKQLQWIRNTQVENQYKFTDFQLESGVYSILVVVF